LNDKAEHIIGNASIGKFHEIFLRRDEFNILDTTLDNARKIVAFEFQLAFDSHRWARIDCQWFREDGFVEGVISDVTESRTQLLELERLNADLDNFIYRASHDLRSPLTTLMGLINLLESDGETAPQVYYEMIRDRVIHLDHLLADLAAITYNNKAKVTIEPLDLETVREIILSQYSQSAKITFSSPSTPVFYTDTERLLTVFKKLISYSIRYNNPTYPLHEIDISVLVNEDAANIIFRDNGRGVSVDQLSKVFDLFHKTTNDVTDTGLGLYMTKLLVEKLNGTITMSSIVGKGTEIFVTIPNVPGPPVISLS
jgi:signal transduction histidine kinase